MKVFMLRVLAVILVLVTGVSEALSQSSWTNGSTVNGNWNSNKWANGVPTSSSDVFITNQGGGGIYTVTLTNYAAINSLTMSAPSTATNTFKLSSTGGQLGLLYLSNGMTVGSDSIFDSGGQTITGSVTIASGGRMAASTAAGTVPATIVGTVTNNGTINLVSGSGGNRNWGGLVNNGVLTMRYGFQTSQIGFNAPNSLFLNTGGSVLVSNENQGTRLGFGYNGGPVLTNFGAITLYAVSTNTTSGSARITVGGDLTKNEGGSNLLVNVAGAQINLISQGGTNAGFLSYTTPADVAAFLRNEGTLTVSGTNASRILSSIGGVSTNAGTIQIQGTLDFYGASSTKHSLVNQNGGSVSIDGGILRILGPGAAFVSTYAGSFRNEGVVTNLGSLVTFFNLTNAAGGTMVSMGTFSTSVVNQGSMIFLGGTSRVAVGTLVSSGSLDFQSNSVLSLAGSFLNQGTMNGSGKVLANAATNSGTLSPGHSPGTLTFSSNLTLAASSVLNIELGGTNAVDFDHLMALGALTLGGTLNVTLTNGYSPTSGDTVDILDWGSMAGTFATINLPSAQWSTNSLYSSGTLIYSAIPESGIAWAVVVGCGVLALWRQKRPVG